MSDSVPNSATDYCNGPILHALTGVNNSSAKLEKELNALRQKSIYNLVNVKICYKVSHTFSYMPRFSKISTKNTDGKKNLKMTH